MSDPTRTETVTVGDGTFDLPTWVPDQGSGPGILLLHEIAGVSAYIRAVAARLARDGYTVAAPDLFWRIEPGWSAPLTEEGLHRSLEMAARFDTALGVTDSVAALDALRALPEVRGGTGVLGFCMGGTLAHLVAADSSPDALVSYYGSGVPAALDRFADIACPALYHFGGNDPYIPPESVAEIRAAIEATGRDDLAVEVQPDAGHAFDNHDAPLFHDAIAAAAAWAVTETFLADHLRSA